MVASITAKGVIAVAGLNDVTGSLPLLGAGAQVNDDLSGLSAVSDVPKKLRAHNALQSIYFLLLSLFLNFLTYTLNFALSIIPSAFGLISPCPPVS